MQRAWSYIKDSGDFIKKTRKLGSIPKNSILVTADIVDLYPSIPHEAGLKALRGVLGTREQHTVPMSEQIRMADFVLKNNYFEFNGQIKEQIPGTAIGSKFSPPYPCLFKDKIETNFLETQELHPLVWFRYIGNIFFIWRHGEQELQIFLHILNEFCTDPKFTYNLKKKALYFLTLKLVLKVH